MTRLMALISLRKNHWAAIDTQMISLSLRAKRQALSETRDETRHLPATSFVIRL